MAINALGSSRRMAMSMGAGSVEEAARELGALLKAKPPASFGEAIQLLGLALDLRHAKPKLVGQGACQEVALRAAELAGGAPEACPTLATLPILKCWPLDAGRFITLTCVVTRDPRSEEHTSELQSLRHLVCRLL